MDWAFLEFERLHFFFFWFWLNTHHDLQDLYDISCLYNFIPQRIITFPHRGLVATLAEFVLVVAARLEESL